MSQNMNLKELGREIPLLAENIGGG